MPILTVGTGRSLIYRQAATVKGPPTLTFRATVASANGAANPQLHTGGWSLGGASSEELLVIATIAMGNGSFALSAATLKRSGESDIVGTPVLDAPYTTGTDERSIRFVTFVLPTGSNAFDIETLYSSTTFAGDGISVFTVPTSQLNSNTPTDTDHTGPTATLGPDSIDISSESGGIIIAAGLTRLFSNTIDLSGDETYTQDAYATIGGGRQVVEHASGVSAAVNSNTITANETGTAADLVLAAASWR